MHLYTFRGFSPSVLTQIVRPCSERHMLKLILASLQMTGMIEPSELPPNGEDVAMIQPKWCLDFGINIMIRILAWWILDRFGSLNVHCAVFQVP